MDNVTTVTSKGQVTIPLNFRQAFNIKPGTMIKFELDNKEKTHLKIKPVKTIFDLEGIVKTNKKYDKQKARATYIPLVVAGKI